MMESINMRGSSHDQWHGLSVTWHETSTHNTVSQLYHDHHTKKILHDPITYQWYNGQEMDYWYSINMHNHNDFHVDNDAIMYILMGQVMSLLPSHYLIWGDHSTSWQDTQNDTKNDMTWNDMNKRMTCNGRTSPHIKELGGDLTNQILKNHYV